MPQIQTGIGLGINRNQLGARLNQLLQKFAFWSKENPSNYYASLEDDSPYYSLLEKE